VEDWASKIAFMRAHGVTVATWADGALIHAELGPAPAAANVSEQPAPMPTVRRSARDVALASGGTLIVRDDAT
jgi:hypothetical protein